MLDQQLTESNRRLLQSVPARSTSCAVVRSRRNNCWNSERSRLFVQSEPFPHRGNYLRITRRKRRFDWLKMRIHSLQVKTSALDCLRGIELSQKNSSRQFVA